MYERIVTFTVGLLLGVVVTFGAMKATAKPAAILPASAAQIAPPQDMRDIIRQANETQGRYREQVADLQSKLNAAQQLIDVTQNLNAGMKNAITTWTDRASACETKFQTGTIILEPRPIATLPIARGLFSVDVNAGGALAGATPPSPVLFVHAQVQVTSRIPGVTYLWINPQGGAVKGGPFAAELKP